jgi:hypothetical protein
VFHVLNFQGSNVSNFLCVYLHLAIFLGNISFQFFIREGSNMDNATGVPKLMSLHLLEEITDGFSKHRKLGGGAYGDVYLV